MINRYKLTHEFTLDESNKRELGEDLTLTVRVRVVGLEHDVADVTRFGSAMKEYITTGTQTVTVLPLAAKVERA